MSELQRGLDADPLFVGATRPPMRWGVTYSALLFNMVFTMEVFLLTKNLLTLLLCAPIHGLCVLLCARDARYFDLLLLWGRTRLPRALRQLRLWKAQQLSPAATACLIHRSRGRSATRCELVHSRIDRAHRHARP